MHKRLVKILSTIIIVTGLALVAVPGLTPTYAQQAAPITAEVDRSAVTLGETITLTVTITTDSISPPAPDMPALDGFDILGTSTSSSLSLTNGQVASSAAYIFTLRPLRTGTLTIPPFGVKIKDQPYQSEAIQIEVAEAGPNAAQTPAQVPPPGGGTSGGANGGANGEAFAKAEVDNPNPYVGQALAYIFRFYHASPLLGRPYYSAPTYTGFWTEKETAQKEYDTQMNGAFYQVTELHTVLFPTAPGDLTIPPARLTIPGSFFDEDVQLESGPVVVHVQPLPDGAPPGFDGAVGKYTINGEVSTLQGKAGEPITYTLTINGEGNLKNLPDPHWPDMPGWRVFDSKGRVDTKIDADRVTGTRVYERLLVPPGTGVYTIPALSYVYFDPEKAAYETISTQVLKISIQAGEAEAATLQAPPAPKSKMDVEQISSDVRFLKPLPPGLGRGGLPLVSDAWYGMAWGLCVLIFLGNLAWEWAYTRRRENAPVIRSSQARQRARKALARRLRMAGGNAYAAAVEILTDYLTDKLGQPVAGLTRPLLADLLVERGVTPAAIQRLQEALDAAEAGRFSPQASAGGDGLTLLRSLSAVLDDLEKGFGK